MEDPGKRGWSESISVRDCYGPGEGRYGNEENEGDGPDRGGEEEGTDQRETRPPESNP